MPVNNPFALTAGIQYVDGTASTATAFTGTVAMSFNASNQIVGLRSDASDNLLVNVAAFSGTVTVAGNLTHNNAAPTADNIGALVAVASSASPTYNAGDQVLLSTDLAGNLRVAIEGSVVASNNITEWNSVALGSPSVYGTSPGAVNVIGVNAFVTNTVTVSGTVAATQSGTWNVGVTGTVAVTQSTSPWVVSLASTTITGTVAVTQSTSPWVVAGSLTHNNAAPAANNVGVLPAVASTAAPTYTTGDQVLLSTDLAGNLRTSVLNTVTVSGTVAATQSGTWTTTVTQATAANLNATVVGTGTFAVQAAQSGTWTVQQGGAPWSFNLTQLNGTALGSGTNWGTAPATSVNVQGVNAEIFVGQNAVSATNPVPISATAAANASGNPIFVQAVSGSTTVVTGTVAVTQSTSPWVVSLTSTTITGTVAVTQSTSPWVVAGALTHNAAAPAANNVGALVAVASTAAPTYTAGDQVLLSTDLAGNLRVSITGSVVASNNITEWNSVALGSPSAYGTSPGAVNVIGVNAFITNTPAVTVSGTVGVTQSTSPWVVSLTSTTITGTVAVTQSGTWTVQQGGAPWSQNLTQWAGTALGTPTNFGTTPGAVVAGSVNSSVFIGTVAAVAASAGVQKVGISGATGVALDAAQNAAAPANELVVGAVFNTTTPALTAGNASQLQADSTGSLQVNTEGKKQTYRCGIISFGPLASSSPTISVTGSATKTIRIIRMRTTVAAATGAIADVSLKRFSALSGGTSASQSANIAKLDTNNATATAVVSLYTAAATTATAAGVLAAERYEIVTAAVSVQPGQIEWDFSDKNGQACVLRGTGDFVGIVFSAIGTTPDGDCWIEWTEE